MHTILGLPKTKRLGRWEEKGGGHWGGGEGGYRILQYRKKNRQIPKYRVKNRRNTDTAVMKQVVLI